MTMTIRACEKKHVNIWTFVLFCFVFIICHHTFGIIIINIVIIVVVVYEIHNQQNGTYKGRISFSFPKKKKNSDNNIVLLLQ